MMKVNMLEAVAQQRRRWARGAVASALVATLALSGCAGGTYGDDGGEADTREEIGRASCRERV